MAQTEPFAQNARNNKKSCIIKQHNVKKKQGKTRLSDGTKQMQFQDAGENAR